MTTIANRATQTSLSMTAAAVWERRLARENLAPIDTALERSHTPRRSWRSVSRAVEPVKAEAVEQWLAWAQEVLRSHKFDTPWQRRVWSLYAQGRRLSEVAIKLRASKRAVTRALERVERWAPPPPVENPWRKVGTMSPLRATRHEDVRTLLLRTNRRVAVRICMLALECADKSKLREIFGSDPVLLRLVPQAEPTEDTMAEAKKLHYTRIVLKRDLQILGPRIGAPIRRNLVNIDGVPHAGGINVELETRTNGVDTRTTVTIPWDGILQADRVEPEAATE